jgi:TonB family protein
MLFADASKFRGLIALVIVSLSLSAQEKPPGGGPKPERCQASPVSTPDPDFPEIKDWKPVELNAPTAELRIREDGSVKSVRLIRSSNVKEWDQVFVTAVRKWKFSKAPNCGFRKTTVSVDIHVR